MLLRRPYVRWLSLLILPAIALAAGCGTRQKPQKPVSRYTQLPPKKVPEFLKGTIFERTELVNTDSFPVSGYGLVVNLDGTGNSNASNRVRQYMLNEMTKHGYGSDLLPGMKDIPPERVLRDPRCAIVRVDGFMPPGIRQKQMFDVQVSALPESTTSSLARGELCRAELRIRGADPINPGGSVNLWARSQGPVFVNPVYALARNTDDPDTQRSLRRGVVMDGGVATIDRPLALRLRQPQRSLAKRIEFRVDDRFQEIQPDVVAAAQDEGIVHIYVPRSYEGDWQHFAKIVQHIYLNGSPGFLAQKASELAEEAVKPGAWLEDISYCWEALGPKALPHFRDLMTHPSEDVSFAAARAAAFLGEPTAPQTLARMARTKDHKFQINAIEALGALHNSPAINELLRPLLDGDQTLARIEAYKALARHKDGSIFTTVIQDKFVLDVMNSAGPPIVYASRRGIPRIAVMGRRTTLELPITFTAMNNQLSITSSERSKNVTIFYRGRDVDRPVQIVSEPDIVSIIARLGGEGAGAQGLRFSYGEIVAILNAMSESRKLSAVIGDARVPTAFVLQELPRMQEAIQGAPPLPESGRPQSDQVDTVGMAK